MWALPFLTVLAPSRRYRKARSHRHKTITDWARQMLCLLRRERRLRPRRAAWYAKTVPTFADVLACVRHTLWTRLPLFFLSPATPDIRKRPQPPPAPLLAALCYSA